MPGDVAVMVLALAFIAWELWYFRGRRDYVSPGDPAKSRTQEFRVTLRGGFDPDFIIFEAGRPGRLGVFRCELDTETEPLAFDTPKIPKAPPEKSEERFSRNAETELGCRLLL